MRFINNKQRKLSSSLHRHPFQWIVLYLVIPVLLFNQWRIINYHQVTLFFSSVLSQQQQTTTAVLIENNDVQVQVQPQPQPTGGSIERERANYSTEDVTEKALISESYDNLSFDIPTISLETNNSNDVFELHNFRNFVVGGKKCLFLLESNPSVGYLVTQELLWRHRENKNAFDKFKKTYQFSFDLERDYNVTSMFIDPPREIHKNVSFYNELQKKSKKLRTKGRQMELFRKDRPFVVQKTRLAPDSHIVFQYISDQKRVHWFPGYTRFLTKSNVTDYDAFLTNLGRDLNTMNAFLNDRKYSTLSNDFQFIIDITGHIHHLDLDRAFEHRVTQKNVQVAVNFLEAVQNNFEAAVNELK